MGFLFVVLFGFLPFVDFSLEEDRIRKKGKTKLATQTPVLAASENVLIENDSGF